MRGGDKCRSKRLPLTPTLSPREGVGRAESAARPPRTDSAARIWAPLARFIEAEARIGDWAERRPATHALYELVRFGIKQGWACLFGALLLALLIGTHLFYPKGAWLARYDFLVLAAVAIQVAMLAFKLETWEEAKVIFIFHVVGTAMEIFKTSVGSWLYPEASLLRIGGVPLFTGFMYAAIGSYIARCWRLFDFRFTRHPPLWALSLLAAAIYVNFFAHHYCPTRGWRCSRSRPCCSGAAGSISRSGACTGACRCCWASRWSRSSSGWPRTSAPSRRPGCTPARGSAGRWSRWASSAPGSC